VDRDALLEHARQSIRRGSTSFSTASRLFDRTTRERVWLLYAWCRACDDLADAQEHGGQLGDQSGSAARLAAMRALTLAALAGEQTGNPAFDAFGLLSRESGLTRAMTEDVLAGFALDAAGWRPQSEADMLRYCYHVAGAVGVMMATVMGVPATDEDTLDRAADLGVAFQLANIARDVIEDHAAGRCYLPGDWLTEAGIAPSALLAHRVALADMYARLAALAVQYETSARIGARRLGFRQRWAVLSAACIYGSIAREAARRGEAAAEGRIITSTKSKLGFVARAFVESLLPAPVATRPRLSRRDLAALARCAG
jgi:phytoene synthase